MRLPACQHFAGTEENILRVSERFVSLIPLNMRLARIYDSKLIQLNIHLKRQLISTKNELQSFGSFWRRLYLEKSGPYCWCILNKIVIPKAIKINSWNIAVLSTVRQFGNIFCKTTNRIERSGVQFPMVSVELTKSVLPYYALGVDSTSNKNEYQEYFQEVKTAGAYGWQSYLLYVPLVLLPGSLYLL